MFDERQFSSRAEGVLEPKTVIAYFTELAKKMDTMEREAEKLRSTIGYADLHQAGFKNPDAISLLDACNKLHELYDKSMTAILSATNRMYNRVELQGEQINQLQKSMNSLKRKPRKK